jgi:hypothetical protein
MLALSLLASACVVLPGRIDIGVLVGGLTAAPPATFGPASATLGAEPTLVVEPALVAEPPLVPESPQVVETPARLPVDTAPAAVELPLAPPPVSSAEPLLPRKRIVAYYGNPLATGMGVLGEQPLPQSVQRLRRQAQAYAEADPMRPVQLALELITPVAQGAPGPDGLYRLRMPAEVIDEVTRLAEQEHLLVILDVQIGQSTVADELQVLLPYLERPYVHLALDPEFAIADKHGEPGEVIGTLDASDVNYAIRVLTDIVAAHHLPPKVLVVHRFLEKMLTNHGAVQPTPSVQVVIDMDGFGTQYVKGAKYETFVQDQGVQFGGVKLFYKHDKPLWTPKDVLDLQPAPDLIIYQ